MTHQSAEQRKSTNSHLEWGKMTVFKVPPCFRSAVFLLKRRVDSKQPGTTQRFWPHIVILVLASIAFFAYVTFLVLKRKFGKSPPQRRAAPSSKAHERETTPTPRYEDYDYYSEPSSEGDVIDHIDLTDMKVEATIKPHVKEKILQCLREGPRPLKARRIFANPPKIVKVITYGTSEHITLMEEALETPESTYASKTQATTGQQAAEELLIQLIDNGPREFHFDRAQLQEVLRLGAQIFFSEDSLLEVPVPCIVYGDTHGQYSDLLRCVFLGDFVDRGSHGVELFTLITCLKVCFPDNIFVLRGNHEEESLNQLYSFASEVQLKFDSKMSNLNTGPGSMYSHFKNVFMNLPLACLIGGDILAMHGGISPMLRNLQDIQQIERPIDEFVKGTLACDLVWSDPDTLNNVEKYEPNLEREATVGIGQLFSKSAVKETCRRLGVKMIIRGHQAPLHGYASWAGGRLITLFSAPAYKGSTEETVNLGACIEAPETGELIIKQLKVNETIRKKRAHDVHTRQIARANVLGDSEGEFAQVLPVSLAENLAIDKTHIYKY
ncbi:Ser/Thr phosphatase family protein [Ancylostoma ceylanicum]|uniref:Serine/threonine-protein phosphatase n=1 Tax=Ancylostoma ceylanicum TaxID=53326 RepID=A0A0D6LBQ9_9BILA|nr:Ser/Thr phosphatase family protein [Ancylostoma ceylanicum]